MKSTEGTLRRRAFIMALEVAHAYDDNKNLVPLYIVTDSDPVYEPTTPGFFVMGDTESPVSDSKVYVTNNAMNPTGGQINNGNDIRLGRSYINTSPTITIINESNFDITFIFQVYYEKYGYVGNTTTMYSEDVLSKNQKAIKISDITTNESILMDEFSLRNVIIQRVL